MKLRKNYLERWRWSSLYVMLSGDETAAALAGSSWVLTLNFITRHSFTLPVE